MGHGVLWGLKCKLQENWFSPSTIDAASGIELRYSDGKFLTLLKHLAGPLVKFKTI